MPIKRYKPEQIVTMLRQIEVSVANGKTTPQACKEAEITMQTFYRWRKEYGGLKLEQAKRMKDLEKENTRLKRLVAELSLEKQVLSWRCHTGSPADSCWESSAASREWLCILGRRIALLDRSDEPSPAAAVVSRSPVPVP